MEATLDGYGGMQVLRLSVGSRPSHMAIVLGLFYLLLATLVSIQIAQIVYYGHNLLSFQPGFLFLCLLWSLLRAMLLLFPLKLSVAAFFLEWIPTTLQFATFLLLTVYYAYLVERTDWEKRRVYWHVGVVAAVSVSTIICLVTSLLLPVFGAEAVCRFQVFFSGITFLALAITLLFYSYRLYEPLRSVSATRRKYQSASRMLWISRLLILSFLSRAFTNLVATAGWIDYTILDGTRYSTGFRQHPFEATFSLLIWEIIPILVLVAHFWHIPRVRSTFRPLSKRGLIGSLDQLRKQYGSVEALPSSSLGRYAPQVQPQAYVDRGESATPTGRTLPSMNEANRFRQLTEDEPDLDARKQNQAANQQGEKASSQKPPAPPGKPPSYASKFKVGDNRPLLDNPHRYDTDDENTSLR